MKPEDILTDLEIEKVRMFVQDTQMKEAVKKVILFELYQNGVLEKGKPANAVRNTFFGVAMTIGLTKEQIGERVCAIAEGLNFLEAGFNKMEKYAVTLEKVVNKQNPAR